MTVLQKYGLELIDSPYFFARKFSEEHMGIINKLANYLKEV
jgi:hypothetical protein